MVPLYLTTAELDLYDSLLANIPPTAAFAMPGGTRNGRQLLWIRASRSRANVVAS